MAKADPESSKGRKRQLNVIYFIDSARTRSLTMSLGRLNVLIAALLMVGVWSVACAFLLVWLARGREDQAGRLRAALATIFEYETRDDKVFDVAYPPAGKGGAAPQEAAAETGIALSSLPAPAAEAAPAVHPAVDKPAGSRPAEPVDEPVDEPAPAAAAAAAPESPVIVANPVLEAGATALALRFDLTNKSGSDRAEGMVWAVAEFKTDSGEQLYIGAPAEIQVRPDGQPAFPLKAALFGIRRFKQKSFSFPLPPHLAGTFTGLKIGVMDRSGANRTTYNVPIKLRAGKGDKDESDAAPPGAPKQG